MIHREDICLYIIAGQGTIGLELLTGMPEIDTALVPLSGGGLIAGIVLALKSASPQIRKVDFIIMGGYGFNPNGSYARQRGGPNFAGQTMAGADLSVVAIWNSSNS